MSLRRTISSVAMAATLGFLASSTSMAENAITAPATKSIGASSTHKTELVPSLIVMNADGATLKGDTLTLTSISNNSILFADRPVRSAGHALTTHLLEEWAEGGSFEKDPPNATVSVLNKDASSVEDAVVVLKEPKLEGTNLTFKVDVLEGSLAKADGPASIFIDIIGMPRTPMSFAGVARRTAYRGAWYGAAAAGAAAAYDRPYYPPRACGYYPLPPC
ncbi:hypothetical protein [Rhizobium mesoamericanum]|uniref:Uncharacterized protein n=1 Tax=Rhizobium mesoamericanum STM3625 TaxID=1211777 RepID=K0PVS5_9HYPH|nr:hypothetical protein [Rhizobium mesoamericanum]CCM75292.1 conserved exported hypothetical protein [Rhizobium mesoamericanum STM3625]